MATINVLEDSIINKIAAGEVVERPASVIKELLENSLDAKAKHIFIELTDGGLSAISIRDDGTGIAKGEAHLVPLRHATSKIQKVDDLFGISSLGFRGEAMASIASVSRLTISSVERGKANGFRMQNREGSWHYEDWQSQGGTRVEVEDLFFNVPARLKFLKTPARELILCKDWVKALALVNPDVTISLKEKNKEAWIIPASVATGEEALRERLGHVWPGEDVTQFVYACEESAYCKVEGLFSPPGYEKASANMIACFVNGRWVKDQNLRYGILRGYQSHLLKGKYPAAVLFVSCEPSLIDVNVHPAKTEVRFQYPSEVQGLIASAIRQALRQGSWALAPAAPAGGYGKAVIPSAARVGDLVEQGTVSSKWDARRAFSPGHDKDANAVIPSAERVGDPIEKSPASDVIPAGDLYRSNRVPNKLPFGMVSGKLAWQKSAVTPSSKELPKPDERLFPWTEMRWLGPIFGCYLLFEHNNHFLIIDQHAFHERVIFERLSKDASLLKEVYPLLVPEILTLNEAEVLTVSEKAKALKKLGFDLHAVSLTEVELRAVPGILAKCNFQDFFKELLAQDLEALPDNLSELGAVQPILATLACHSAVRAGQDLEQREWAGLLREALEVDFYLNCPHGRRVFKWFTKSQVEAWFDR